jgi:uncharacterized protein
VLALLLCVPSFAACSQDNRPRRTSATPDRGPFAYDPQRPLDLRKLSRRNHGAVTVQRLSYAAADGERVPALFARPRGVAGPFICVVYQGGLNGRKEAASPVWAPFGADGLATFTIDARYHGSRAHGNLNSQAASRDPRLFERMLRLSVIDLRRGLDYVETRDDCDPDHIGYLGVSFGGFLGALLAGTDKRVKATVLVAAGGHWATILKGTDLLLPRIERDPKRFSRALRLLAPLDPKRWVSRISPRPVFIITGRRDEVIVAAAGRALRDAARSPKRTYEYNGNHADALGRASYQVGVRLLDWLEAKLTSD